MTQESNFKVGDLVFVPIKNRLGLDCASRIESIDEDLRECSLTVFNMGGPGADGDITKVPLSVLTHAE